MYLHNNGSSFPLFLYDDRSDRAGNRSHVGKFIATPWRRCEDECRRAGTAK
jgi:hypothetical protein